MRRSLTLLSLVVAGFAATPDRAAAAAEDAAGFYLLGSKGPMAGFVPPPGIYLADVRYYYAGSAEGDAAVGVALRRTGARTATGSLTVEANIEVDAKAYYDIPTALWVAPHKVLGGHLGFSVAIPVGWKDVDVDLSARATLTLPPPLNLTLQRGGQFHIDDHWLAFGDPVAGAFIGWHEGSWHWNLGVLVNVPAGAWQKDKLSNIGFNRWAADLTGAITWLDPKIGLDISAAAGFTFNVENPDTDYKTGTEFHVEFAIVQNFSKSFGLGLSGYHYQQVTGDSGAGAVLGPFKGRVTALGPTVNYNFMLGQIPVNTNVKWLKEFNASNRLEGDAALLTMTMPLSAGGQ